MFIFLLRERRGLWERRRKGIGAAPLLWSDTDEAPFPACGITSEQLFSSVKTLERLLETDALVTGHSEYQKAWVELRSNSRASYIGKCFTGLWQIWVGTATSELPQRRRQAKQWVGGRLAPTGQLQRQRRFPGEAKGRGDEKLTSPH